MLLREFIRNAFESLVAGEIDERKAFVGSGIKIQRGRNRVSRPQSLARDALYEHAQKIAHEQFGIGLTRGRGNELAAIFSRCARDVEEAYATLSRAAYERDLLTPGAEWLLDNFHIIQEQIASIIRDFPTGYDRTLPKLAAGKFRGYSRVFEIALELLSKSDSVVDASLLSSFVNGYQSVSQLTIGEFWAVPIMLRIALVDNISHLALRFVEVREERKIAEQFIDELIGDDSRVGTEILLLVASKIKEEPRLLTSGAPYLLRRLRERGKKATITLQWLEERLREQGNEPEEILRNEQYSLAADQISIGNSITSLRAIGYIDWKSWVESVSLVDLELRKDPTSIYQRGDFKTRDRCRHVIEKLAKRSGVPELEVAKKALQLAQSNFALGLPKSDSAQSLWRKRSTVTFYLLKSLKEIEQELKIDHTIIARVARVHKNVYLYTYILTIALGSVLIALWLLRGLRFHNPALSFALFLLAVIPASELVSNILQWLITRLVRPAHLPKLDFQHGIPEELKTVVIVHAVFADAESAQSTIESLEVRYLANQDPNAVFGILADLRDSDAQELAEDQPIMQIGYSRIDELNNLHGSRFFILFRKRKFNASEGKWMAWERKRGKLEQFNQFVLEESYVGDFLKPVSAKQLVLNSSYIVTLDNDTQLPRGSIQKLLGAAAHPLNSPIFFEGSEEVMEGYSIIQPRIGTTLTSANISLFARVFASHAGLDPYSETVSEVYQDVFGEGSFIGKGLYDVRAFHRALQNRVPENALLSHDLFEGNFARVGLATDIELFDDYPSKYHVHARRQHRWVRGDWQLLPWLFSRTGPGASNHVLNTTTSLGRWKIFDNLRRSLVAPTLFFGLLLSWIFLAAPYEESLFALLVVTFPVYANIAQAFLIPPQRTTSFRGHFRGIGRDLVTMSKQALFTIAMIPHQTVVMCDAICRTVYRLAISKRHLLEWETAYHSDKRLSFSLQSFIYEMGGAVILVLFVVAPVVLINPSVAFWHLPVFVAWLLSPYFAFKVSLPLVGELAFLDVEERKYLLEIARKTWRYFRELINEQNNFLVPDNIQLVPNRIVAQRTSPTNISLSLLSAVSAYKLGFFSLSNVIERLERTLNALNRLERFRGHFLNWYDCIRMAPLLPRYVSTVDSGNFVGHLIAIRSFLRAVPELPEFHHYHADHLQFLLKQAAVAHAPKLNSTTVKELLLGFREISALFSLVKDAQIHGEILDIVEPLFKLLSEERTIQNLDGPLLPDRDLIDRANKLLEDINKIIAEHDFHFLYDSERELFAIGYHVDNARRDQSYYDLLASEARLAGLVTIALGQIPEKHWFTLGRALADSPGGLLLLSWSGTMFEYLMPVIVTRDYRGTILSESYRAIVKAQQSYVAQLGVPWGISESSFSGVDFEKTYQYRAFGVPGLGLKRGLEDDLVISPYSTALALMISPKEAIRNFKALEKEHARGEYGFYEALDYTKSRLATEETKHIVQNFFAHHQGMSLCAFTNVLCDSAIQDLFHADPIIKATELLLQERFPDRADTVITPAAPNQERNRNEEEAEAVNATIIDTPHSALPRTHLLSNSRYSVMVDNAGSGFSVYERDFALTRWREDQLVNQCGTYIYFKDRRSGFTWSATYQPTRVEAQSYEVIFSSDKVEYKRRDRNIASHTQIVVSPEDNVEIRKVSLINLSSEKRTVEVTSFGEVVLNSIRADQSHPAFSKMFIESEYLSEFDCLVFSRRPRSSRERPQFLFHMLTMKTVWERVEFESSKFSFIGRGHTVENPKAIEGHLTESKGSILDPIFSLRTGVEVGPGHAESLNFITGYAASREEMMQLILRYRELHQISRAFEMAWSQASVEIRNEQVSAKLFPSFQRLANVLLFNVASLRGGADIIQRNKLFQQNLWRFGISGDLPIALVRITESNQVKLAQELLAAHSYLRQRGVGFDLVLLNEYPGGYLQNLHEELDYVIRSSHSASLVDRPGGIFLRSLTQMSEEERELLAKVARVVLHGSGGSLQQQIRLDDRPLAPPQPVKRQGARFSLTRQVREFDSGYGGFVMGGKAYSMDISVLKPPLPYANVVANPNFGFLVTESGGGYTWSGNSRENRLTAWSNDPITDPVTEIVFIREPDSGEFWSATPEPASHGGDYRVEHHFGFSSFSTRNNELESALHLSVAGNAKCFSLKLTNRGRSKRRLEILFYCELVLGVSREESARFQNTVFDPVAQALFVSNNYNSDFPGRVVAAGSNRGIVSFTAQRSEIIGRNRSVRCPLVFEESPGVSLSLSRKTGAGFDPCAGLLVEIEIGPGRSEDILFFLAEYDSAEAARIGCARLCESGLALKESENFRAQLSEILDAVQVKTPVRSFDILLNGWLLYQLLTSRLYGRTGLYQSGGAFGFRDQLQDVMALLYARPQQCRLQLLLHASRQFPEGDVQHWWHPPSGKGVRTRISDDFLWLPLVAARYLQATGDFSIFEEEVNFIEGHSLSPDEHEAYIVPKVSEMHSSFYEHCARAIERALHFGVHNLPLMGVGDWNDGMNEVGKEGRGESVWLAWFLALVVKEFLPIVELRARADAGELNRLNRFQEVIPNLVKAVEEQAWDGQWYRRAYFDDGTPLGSSQNDECQIDSLPQTWAVLSGLAKKERQNTAMQVVYHRLVDEKVGVIKLFDPPFDQGSLHPGYIKGYLPGVRENGGQYTHAAVWVVMAAAELGDAQRAFKYFQMINPVTHCLTKGDVELYQGEPYVLCGDVYAAQPFVGRAGWSWYTGSAGWLYQAGVSSILGLKLLPDGFMIQPCIPEEWPGFKMEFSRDGVKFLIDVVKTKDSKLEKSGTYLGETAVLKILYSNFSRGAVVPVRVVI